MIKLSSEIHGKIVSLFRRAPSVFALITTEFPKSYLHGEDCPRY